MKILFIDDEPAILRTIRRTLRNLPACHQLDLEPDPLAAIARLSETSYDLVVSDMRMPGRSGCQVLEQAALHNPGGVRAVLSGYSGEEETASVAQHAHLFIGKPFDPKAITDLIARAEALGAMPLSDALRRRLGGLKALPPIPKLFVALTKALAEEQRVTSLDDIAAILGQDVALSAKILQLANSAFFGGVTRAVRVEQAVKLLGTRLVSGLVLQHEIFVKSPVPPALEAWRERLNQKSLATAELAARIARQRGMSALERDESSLAGLLHDVGRLVLIGESNSLDPSDELFAMEPGRDLCRHEESLFGAHHGWVGAYLLRLWGFSPAVVDALAWHHEPSRSGIAGISPLTLVHAADAIVNTGRDGEADLDREYLSGLGCLDEYESWAALAGSTTPDSLTRH
ncbi:HDOD domain-containing protein [Thiocystis violacea]|uniref:HDOD domain-containing protein n=1 Tax=Thiocystis violacea TaxID=13725 RepID=UPI0019067E03|nr:HDOD domain-containing protein [Thiocystis violacea]MBK1720200.1 hypothetical protein [Thiocystis violacea]